MAVSQLVPLYPASHPVPCTIRWCHRGSAVDAVEGAVGPIFACYCRARACSNGLAVRAPLSCVAPCARARPGGAADGSAVDAVEGTVGPILACHCGGSTGVCNLAVGTTVSRIASCARARPGGAADSAAVDAVEGAVAPVLCRHCGGCARTGGLTARAFVSCVT